MINKNNPDLFIIDGIGPFFTGYKKKVINWSKIPFDYLEKSSRLKKKILKKIFSNYRIFLSKAKKTGYNAISLDDVAHLALFDIYPDNLKSKILHYRSFFSQIFSITKAAGMKIFLTTDIMFFNDTLRRFTSFSLDRIIGCLKNACQQVMDDFPIDGIITRIGEHDGNDVQGDFLSSLCITTPEQVNRLIKDLLPLFEKRNRTLIFRTWTVGAFRIGDLMWNPQTYDIAFKGIASHNFIVSMKYGDTDFFGKLDLSHLFFRGNQQKIIEIQTRREREGFGLFPNYIGWEMESYRNQLNKTNLLRGVSVWCQSGGWSRNQDFTFFDASSRWVELNTSAVISLFKHHDSADNVIAVFFGRRNQDKWIYFLRTFKYFFDELLYVPVFRKPRYFRRLRIPPLLWMTWNYITINPFMKGLFRLFNAKTLPFNEMQLQDLLQMGKEMGVKDIDYISDLLTLFLEARLVLHEKGDAKEFRKNIESFKLTWPESPYRFQIENEHERPSMVSAWFFKLFTREQRSYRLFDRVLLLPFVSKFILRITRFMMAGHLPKVTDRKAMSFDTLFR